MTFVPEASDVPDVPTQVSERWDDDGPPTPGWDRPLLVAFLGLVALGLTAILSASAPDAMGSYGTPYGILVRQLVGLGLGLAVSLGILAGSWPRIRRASTGLYVGVLVLMVITASPLGREVNGAQRWLPLGLFNLQVTEIAKPILAMFLGDLLSRNIGRIRQITVPASALFAASPLLLLTVIGAEVQEVTGIPFVGQSDLGAAVVFAALLVSALWVAGLELRILGMLLGVGALLVALAIAAAPYRLDRILSFLGFGDAQGGEWQVLQGFVAMGMGGWTGVGVGRGIAQGDGFLPEAHTDMIAAVIGEEMGVLGWTLLVLLQTLLVARGLHVARRASTLYDAVVATAVSVVLGTQTVINLGVVVGWAPSKGLVLPFISYGASAAVANVVMVAMLLRISTHVDRWEGTDP